MTSAQPKPTWHLLARSAGSLAEVRLECHHAVQLNTRLARGFLPARADDSHTSLAWDPDLAALSGEEVSTPGGAFTLSLRIADLTFIANGGNAGALPLSGKSMADAAAWLADLITERGMDPAPLTMPLHFALDDNPLQHGARFSVEGREPMFRQLSNHYHNASVMLRALATSSPVRCWPHHFDIAILLPGGRPGLDTIGVGLSPGDQTYSEPYFYVTPWPYPDPAQLPRLESGLWHTRAWTGAVLDSRSIEAAPTATEQQRLVEGFIQGALAALTAS